MRLVGFASGIALIALIGCANARSEDAAASVTGGDALTQVALLDPSAQPRVATKDLDRGFVWAALDGPLFAEGGPTPLDPAQHNVSDCLVLSTLSGVALQNPERLRQLVTANADDTFTVHFSSADVVVDRMMPWVGNALLYANRRTSLAIWPEIIEKAYAKLHGSYDVYGQGDIAQRMSELLGATANVEPLTTFASPLDLYTKVDNALASGDIVVLATAHHGTIGTIGGIDQMVGGHKYVVLATERDGDTLWFQLRNPWGHYEPAGDGVDDGVFWLRGRAVEAAYASLIVISND